MRRLLRLLLNPITWILVALGIIAAKRVIIGVAKGDPMPDDETPF